MSDTTDEIYAQRCTGGNLDRYDAQWDPFGNDGMRHMESADVTGGATDMVDDAPERAGLRR